MVRTGLDALLGEHKDELDDARLGIVANHASVTSSLVHISGALKAAGANIAALLGPEHGIRGDVAAGEPVADAFDERLGIPIHSLYGATNAPTPEMLDGIDLMIVDLQDVGARFYTFLYTMANVMAACGASGVPVWVLDRPNPISGLNPEGPVLEAEFASFVGMYPIQVRHALTIGELALLLRARFGVECNLRVIAMQGWSREMWFDETGLPWAPPSPNMPALSTATVYPGMCLLEGTNVSEGRGTPRPFETFGAPWVDPVRLKAALLDYGLPGVGFSEVHFTPAASKFQGNHCAGLQVDVTDRQAFRPVLTGVAVISALRRLCPDHFAFRPANAQGRCFFDLLAGTASVREAIEREVSPWEIAKTWQPGLTAYEDQTREIKLY